MALPYNGILFDSKTNEMRDVLQHRQNYKHAKLQSYKGSYIL